MDLAMAQTPCLLLDQPRLARNIERMRARADSLGVALRPHLKTAKCREIARLLHAGAAGPITVSTLREAEYFAADGFGDILYAVGIAPQRLARAEALAASGCRLRLVADNRTAVDALMDRSTGPELEVLLEIDCDGQRAGLKPDDPDVLALARRLSESAKVRFGGVMTHGGAAYHCQTTEQIRAMARQEREAVVKAASLIRDAGMAAPQVSVGSTPTATFVDHLEGVTDMRPGVFVFQDLYQVGLGVCTLDDLALSVLTTVIGHRPDRNRLLVDAGSLALSKDRSTAVQADDWGYGRVCDEAGRPIEDLLVIDTNQEHGMITHRGGKALDCSRWPIGARLRILPNHACMTAAAYEGYLVTDGSGLVTGQWRRCTGW